MTCIDVTNNAIPRLACSKLSVSGDDRKAVRDERRATNDERRAGSGRDTPSLPNPALTPLARRSSRAAFRSSPLTEILGQARSNKARATPRLVSFRHLIHIFRRVSSTFSHGSPHPDTRPTGLQHNQSHREFCCLKEAGAL